MNMYSIYENPKLLGKHAARLAINLETEKVLKNSCSCNGFSAKKQTEQMIEPFSGIIETYE